MKEKADEKSVLQNEELMNVERKETMANL